MVQPDGTVVWRAAERVTSGRRDAYQLSVATSGTGFAMIWQEGPEGLQPGKEAGARPPYERRRHEQADRYLAQLYRQGGFRPPLCRLRRQRGGDR
mgnify:FL=1